jgi:hypothetical protein
VSIFRDNAQLEEAMLIDLRFGLMWYRVGQRYRAMESVLGDGSYYWHMPFKLDVQFYAAQYAW